MTNIARNHLLLAAAAIAVFSATAGWLLASDRRVAEQAGAGVETKASDIKHEAAAAVKATPEAPAAHAPPTRELVAKWISDATGGDAVLRAKAIASLANAPREDATPVLRRILTDGEPQVDRPLALASLRDLALNQGDDDGAIRDAVRHAIYHGDDFTKADDAQDVLDTIEESRNK